MRLPDASASLESFSSVRGPRFGSLRDRFLPRGAPAEGATAT